MLRAASYVNERAIRTIAQSGTTGPLAQRSLIMLVNVGKGIEIDVAFEQLPATALAHIQYIGARNVLMDCHASVTADEYPDAAKRESVARAMVEKKLAALMAGEVRVQSTREGDPVRAEAKRMATAIISAKLKAAGRKIADVEKDALKAAIDKLLTPELLAQAKARVDAAKAVETDLGDLGL